MKLKKKYQKIFELAMPFYKKGREMEDIHHLIVAEMMINILKEVPLDEEIMMAAALLHDIGYSKILPSKKKKIHFIKKVFKNQEQILKDHMRFGAELARPILKKAGYPKEKIKKICKIISIHDNPSIGLPIKSQEGKVLKEADILWMTTEKAFWLDVKRRPELKPIDWFKILEERFTKDKRCTKYLKTKFSKKRIKEFIEKMKKY